MQKWKNAVRSLTRSFKIQLVISNLEGLPAPALLEREKIHLSVQIEWKGSKRLLSYLSKHVERNCTSRKYIQSDGTVSWDEEFSHDCKLKTADSKRLRSWEINLEVQGSGQESNGVVLVLAKVKVNIAEFVSPGNNSKRVISIPVPFNVGGSNAIPNLKVELTVSEVKTKGSNAAVRPRSQAWFLHSLSSCTRIHDESRSNSFRNPEGCLEKEDAESDNESEISYKNLASRNQLHPIVVTEVCTEEKTENYQLRSQLSQPSLVRVFSLNKRFLRFKSLQLPKDTPLLNKDYGSGGGDDIDDDRRRLTLTKDAEDEDNIRASGFLSSDRFEVGGWEKRELISRDGKFELVTECFLASIDQRSEKAAGSSACTVLATVIADWLHQNPKVLPLRCELNKLIREGSSLWRNLCEDENHKDKFLDQHFDLETVLQAEVRPLKVVSENSYVGFFVFDDMPENLPFLEGVMSFDNIWEELETMDATSEQIYIVSWNDHFFVLKFEVDAIYIIDTLGERLFEGCKNAYILKFSKESRLYQAEPKQEKEGAKSSKAKNDLLPETRNPNLKPESSSNASGDVHDDSSRTIVSEGKGTCKEFIKDFLAAVPLNELQASITKGVKCDAPLHQLLQIEFHHTAPGGWDIFSSLKSET